MVYSGSLAEDYGAWIRKLNDEAMAEAWTPDEKRRAAALTLKGAAGIWHNELAHHIVGWDAWEAALRLNFVPQLSALEWAVQVEERIQAFGEPTIDYIFVLKPGISPPKETKW